MDKILVVDDSPDILETVANILKTASLKYTVTLSGAEALAIMEKEVFSLVISDLMMPEMDGIQLLGRIKASWPDTEVIIVTAYGSIRSAVEAIQKGAYNYILKPFEPEVMLNQIQKAMDHMAAKRENVALKYELQHVKHQDAMIGNTPRLKALTEIIKTVACANATILIQGESGTGKELAANGIHNKSWRKNRPFIKLACAALPESLLENELFGHEKGSFTGAVTQKKGRFEIANGGTIFLDEISEISLAVQVKLLRVLQEREFERVGGTKSIKTDVRIIVATNRDLGEEVKNGRFREDLFYRLNVISITMPSLRERKDDIPLLADYFLQKYKLELNKQINGFTDKAFRKLSDYAWPGNIRELQNVVERAVVLSKGRMLDAGDLPENIRKDTGSAPLHEDSKLPNLREAKRSFEKKYLEKALALNNGNIAHTASMIKLARKNLQNKIKTYNINILSLTNNSNK